MDRNSKNINKSKDIPIQMDMPTFSDKNLIRMDLHIEGMSCASCVAKVEKGLSKLTGVNEVSVNLATAGIGQSTVVGIGSDPVVFTNITELLELFERDPATDAVVIVGEVGGSQEQQAAEFIDRWVTKPVVAYIAGHNAPEGKRMGHAGAIIRDGSGTPQSKDAALRQVGVKVAKYPAEVVQLVQESLLDR